MSNGVHSGGGGTCPGERSFFEERLFHMVYEKEEILQYIIEEDVKFIRMTFCDVMGRLKNVSIMPDELDRAFDYGIAIDASAVAGFGGEVYSDLVLRPDASTLCILPWRPEHGRVVRMFCSVHYPDGRPFEADTRAILARAVEDARKEGYTFFFGPEMEFYLFRLDESGVPTKTPYDHAGYMDVAPEDKGENVRREACLTLEQMGIRPESSHHEEGPGQNEIDFRYDEALITADNIMTFKLTVKTIAKRHGLYATFMPKPKYGINGSGMHVNMSLATLDGRNIFTDENDERGLSEDAYHFIAGLMAHAKGMTAITNPLVNSYKRLVPGHEAPVYIAWSSVNRSPLIRIPAGRGETTRVELRSPDPAANPYLVLAACLAAGLDGIKRKLTVPDSVDRNIFEMTQEERDKAGIEKLPENLYEAIQCMQEDKVICDVLGEHIVSKYVEAKLKEWNDYRTRVSQWELDEYLYKF